ncbi:putative serine/threonine-protein kinase, partial [Trifolium medium]|nr:putative serine/threonine-protein kinase [Trifolium medium]
MFRSRAAAKARVDGGKKHRTRDRARRRLITHANAKSKSEKFPPPHEDGQLGFPLGASNHIDPDIVPHDVPLDSMSYTFSKEPFQAWSGPI